MAGWDERIAQLEAEFPGWHIWRSNADRWWATRTGAVLRREDLGTGRVMTVDADDPSALRDQLDRPGVPGSGDHRLTGSTPACNITRSTSGTMAPPGHRWSRRRASLVSAKSSLAGPEGMAGYGRLSRSSAEGWQNLGASSCGVNTVSNRIMRAIGSNPGARLDRGGLHHCFASGDDRHIRRRAIHRGARDGARPGRRAALVGVAPAVPADGAVHRVGRGGDRRDRRRGRPAGGLSRRPGAGQAAARGLVHRHRHASRSCRRPAAPTRSRTPSTATWSC